MSEEILRVGLAELLKVIRLKQKDGSVFEVTDVQQLRDFLATKSERHSVNKLLQFVELANEICEKSYPFGVEFALTLEKKRD